MKMNDIDEPIISTREKEQAQKLLKNPAKGWFYYGPIAYQVPSEPKKKTDILWT